MNNEPVKQEEEKNNIISNVVDGVSNFVDENNFIDNISGIFQKSTAPTVSQDFQNDKK
jgi:hypothetical protein